MLKFTFGTDLHGNEQDKTAVSVFKRFVDGFKPDLKIFGGDLWNFASLRRGADEEEKKLRLKEDFKAGNEFLEWYKPDVLLLGNHDMRLWDAVSREGVRKSGWQAELCELMIESFDAKAAKLGIKVIPYSAADGFFKTHGVTFSHGFGHGDTMCANMADAFGDVIFGHGHKIIRDTVTKSRKAATGYMMGGLCRRDMDYVRNDLSATRQQAGFGFGVLNDSGPNSIIQAEIIGNKCIVPTDFKEI